jgi:hypothetical protein
MKKILWFAVFALIAVYVVGAIRFSEMGAMKFISDLENLSLEGKSEEFCDHLHDDMEVSISDYSADPPADFEGGKDDFCEYVTKASTGMALLGVSMQARRDDVIVERSWLHPWTAEVSYSETRTTRIRAANVTLNTEGEDEWTLVQTFTGVKVKRLVSETRLAGAPADD